MHTWDEVEHLKAETDRLWAACTEANLLARRLHITGNEYFVLVKPPMVAYNAAVEAFFAAGRSYFESR